MRARSTDRALVAIAALLAVAPARADEDAAVDARPRWGRAVLETAGALGAASVWYWWNQDFNARDWDLRWDWPSWRGKLDLTYVRFDRNDFWTNAGSHPRSGAILHEIARSNGMDLPRAVALNAGATVLWEYVGEFKEMPSMNDLIVNPIAGVPIGEALFQLGQFFRRSAPNPVNWAAATVLTPLVTAHDWLDHERRGHDAVDELGLSREVWHRFALRAGWGATAVSGETMRETELGLRTELVTIPGYATGREARARAGLGALTELDLAVAFDPRAITLGRFASEALLGGVYRQGGGAGLLAGVSSAFEFSVRDRPGLRRDLIGNLGVVGPLVEGNVAWGALHVRARGEGHVDFAMVRPHVLDDLLGSTERFDDIKTPIEWYGYYFAAGGSLAGRVSAEYRWFDGGAGAAWDRFVSLQGHDRFQESVTDDFALHDGRLALRAWLGGRVPAAHVRLGVDLEQLERTGSIPSRGLSRDTVERRAVGHAAFVF